MKNKQEIEKLAYQWVKAEAGKVDIQSEHYCQTRDVFQSRLNKMLKNLLESGDVSEEIAYIISAIVGEIGNNSFDHNLGSWPDIPGIFFGYYFSDRKVKIILADRGRGVLATLKKVKAELKDDREALQTAFTERISGRAPENRGNGLKFVRENIQDKKMHLIFTSGSGRLELNEKMEIKETEESISGCLAILSIVNLCVLN